MMSTFDFLWIEGVNAFFLSSFIAQSKQEDKPNQVRWIIQIYTNMRSARNGGSGGGGEQIINCISYLIWLSSCSRWSAWQLLFIMHCLSNLTLKHFHRNLSPACHYDIAHIAHSSVKKKKTNHISYNNLFENLCGWANWMAQASQIVVRASKQASKLASELATLIVRTDDAFRLLLWWRWWVTMWHNCRQQFMHKTVCRASKQFQKWVCKIL